MRKIKLTETQILILRTSKANGESSKGFVYPKSGRAEAPDWNGLPECGGGLHGLPRGCGDGSLMDWSDEASAQIILVDKADGYLEFEGKCKYKTGEVVYFGKLPEAIKILGDYYPDAPMCGVMRMGGDYSTLTGGYRSTLTGGDGSTLTGGDGSTLTGGNRSTLTGGDGSTLTGGDGSTLTGGNGSTLTGGNCSTLTGGNGSTLTGGDGSTLTGGNRSTLTGGDGSTLTGGNCSTLTGGYDSTLTGGYRSTLTGGYDSTLTGGYRSTLTGGNDSTLTGGNDSTLTWKVWDGSYYRLHVVYVGENGINPNTPYRFEHGKVVEVTQ